MNVTLITSTPDPVQVLASAAKLCYSNSSIQDILERFANENDAKILVKKIMKLGHFSILEHISFTFGIEGVSRACSHQWVRHRLQTVSQQSQRYVEADGEIIVPKSIRFNSEACDLFNRAIREMDVAYNELINIGIPKEDARFILPNASETKFILTMNARELLHIFNLRCCNRAQWEIREMANRMLLICRDVLPIVFAKAGPSCLWGKCGEGSLSCKKPPLDLKYDLA